MELEKFSMANVGHMTSEPHPKCTWCNHYLMLQYGLKAEKSWKCPNCYAGFEFKEDD